MGYVCLAGLLSAGGGATIPLDKLIASADSVVVTQVVQGSASGTVVSLIVKVRRVLKGPLAQGAIVSVTGTLSDPAPTEPAAYDLGIFFLSAARAGRFRLVPPVTGSIPDVEWRFIPLPPGSTPARPASVSPSTKELVLLEYMGALQNS